MPLAVGHGADGPRAARRRRARARVGGEREPRGARAEGRRRLVVVRPRDHGRVRPPRGRGGHARRQGGGDADGDG